MLFFEGKRRRDTIGKSNLEINLVDAWLNVAALDLENILFNFQKCLRMLKFFLLMLDSCCITVLVSLGPVANETAFFTAFELKFNMRSLDSVVNLKIYLAGHLITRLIEWVLSL